MCAMHLLHHACNQIECKQLRCLLTTTTSSFFCVSPLPCCCFYATPLSLCIQMPAYPLPAHRNNIQLFLRVAAAASLLFCHSKQAFETSS
jgi:hypothetical protein